MTKLKAVLLGLTLSFICTSPVQADAVIDYSLMSVKYRAWNALCLQYVDDRSCEGIAPPKIKRESMRAGLRGYYDGSDTVYINRDLRGYQREATIFHEMSHYLDTRLGLNPEMPVRRADTEKVFGLCVSEKRAWDATDWWWRAHLRKERAVDGKWVTWYDHCRQFADRLYPELYKEPLPTNSGWFFRAVR